MTTDHRAEAERWIKSLPQVQHVGLPLRAGDRASIASAHLLAEIHDLLAERLPTKGEPCPCGCRRDVEPKPLVSRDTLAARLAAVETCDCEPCSDPESETVTVTLPRDVVERARDRLLTAAQWASEGNHPLSAQCHLQAARALSDAIADALEDQS